MPSNRISTFSFVHPFFADNARFRLFPLGWNNLYGTLPEELRFLDLKDFLVTGGSMVGTIPSSFANFSRLRNLGLNDNCFTGTVPEELNDIASLEVLAVYNNNYGMVGNLEPFCETPTSFREGAVAIMIDYGVDCSCCVKCRPEEYECDDPIWNVTWPTLNFRRGDDAYDQRGNLFQSEIKCLSPEQREWLDDECPCVVEDKDADPENFGQGNNKDKFYECDDCSSDGSRPITGN